MRTRERARARACERERERKRERERERERERHTHRNKPITSPVTSDARKFDSPPRDRRVKQTHINTHT